MPPTKSTLAVNSLLDKAKFPQLPKDWKNIPEAVAWHGKVSELFEGLKSCDVDGFQEIISRLKGLKVRTTCTRHLSETDAG